MLAAERLGSCCSALICACDNCANCSVFSQTTRKQRKMQSLETSLSVILVIAIFLSSRVNPCEIKVVFSSETRGDYIKCPNMVEIVAFYCQRMAQCCFPSNGCGITDIVGETSGDGCWSISRESLDQCCKVIRAN